MRGASKMPLDGRRPASLLKCSSTLLLKETVVVLASSTSTLSGRADGIQTHQPCRETIWPSGRVISAGHEQLGDPDMEPKVRLRRNSHRKRSGPEARFNQILWLLEAVEEKCSHI